MKLWAIANVVTPAHTMKPRGYPEGLPSTLTDHSLSKKSGQDLKQIVSRFYSHIPPERAQGNERSSLYSEQHHWHSLVYGVVTLKNTKHGETKLDSINAYYN